MIATSFTLFLILQGFIASLASSSSDLPPSLTDDAASYSGFFLSSPMPFARSDMKANLFNHDFGDGKGPRMYLIGGCIANQTCSYSAPYLNCACPTITNACEYFTPDTEEWFHCASAPTDRFQHASKKIIVNYILKAIHYFHSNEFYYHCSCLGEG